MFFLEDDDILHVVDAMLRQVAEILVPDANSRRRDGQDQLVVVVNVVGRVKEMWSSSPWNGVVGDHFHLAKASKIRIVDEVFPRVRSFEILLEEKAPSSR